MANTLKNMAMFLKGNRMDPLVIYMSVAGPNVYKPSLKRTVETLTRNIGIERYKWFFSLDKEDIKTYIETLIPEDKIEGFYINGKSWANNFNKFTATYKDKYEYVLITHDDLIVNTPDLFHICLKEIRDKKEDIGWITFTNTHYHSINVHVSTRAGFYKDREKRKIFECSDDKRVYPERAVKVYGPYTHLNLISFKALEKIGDTPDWTKYTILIDEHWCLKSLYKGLTNIWIPYVFYNHPDPEHLKNRKVDLRFEAEAHKKFTDTWGIRLPYDSKDIQRIINERPNLKYLTGYSTEYHYLEDEA